MSNELTGLNKFSKNLFKHAFLLLGWFGKNFDGCSYKVDNYTEVIRILKALKKNKTMFFGSAKELTKTNKELIKFYDALAPEGDVKANRSAIEYYAGAWKQAWNNRAAFQFRGYEVKLMKYFHEIINGQNHTHLPELQSMARLIDMNIVKLARQIHGAGNWTVKGALPGKAEKVVEQKLNVFGNKEVTIETVEKARKTMPDAYKKYQQALKDYKHIAHLRMIEIFDEEVWFPTVDSDTLRARLKEENLEVFLPPTFKGRLGVQHSGHPLTFYTHTGLELEKPPLNDVVMNENYGKTEEGKEYKIHPVEDGTFYCETSAVIGNSKCKYYTLEYKRRAHRIKYETVEKLAIVIDDVREKLLTHLNSEDRDTWVRALICLVIDSKYARIGNMDSTKGKKKTYGVTTLRTKEHVRIRSDQIVIRYKGKHGQQQKHRFKIYKTSADKKANPKEAAIADRLLELIKENNEFLFTHTDGRAFTPQSVNDYFTADVPDLDNGLPQGGAGSLCTVHNLRNYHATRIFTESVSSFAKKHPKASYKAIFDKYKRIVEKIAGHLGNTPGICRKSYIDPKVQLMFFKQAGCRPPDMLIRDVFVNEEADIYGLDDKPKTRKKNHKAA